MGLEGVFPPKVFEPDLQEGQRSGTVVVSAAARQSLPLGESYLPRIMHGVSHDLFAVGCDFDRKFDGLRVAFL